MRNNLYWLSDVYEVLVGKIKEAEVPFRSVVLANLQNPLDIAVAPLLGFCHHYFQTIQSTALLLKAVHLRKAESQNDLSEFGTDYLYWCDYVLMTVERIKMDGTNRTEIIDSNSRHVPRKSILSTESDKEFHN
ncbi:hypothetical protein E2C01_070714 [Portunus trituberculatus]|uniref:Uncharacterized protein n=1 Tax=Portunus trituberculatus TaxID=210409 RepID=A0A5B7I666_PORTR|nr:hypothetical protein [Portunus trituberculatus]